MSHPEAVTGIDGYRLGLGGAGIGNYGVALDDVAARDILEEAWSSGIRLFDTAPHYGLGLSELRLGEFLANRPRSEFHVSTKVGRRLENRPNPAGSLDDEGFMVPADTRRVWDFSAQGIRAGVQESLNRLGLEHLDTVYLHDPERWDLHAALDDGLPVLQTLKEEGLVRAVGIGSMDGAALLAAARTGAVDELMVAGRYTLVDQRAAEELLPWCEQHGVAVVAAAVFNGGLLASTPTAKSTYDYAEAPPAVLSRAQALAAACEAAGVPLPAAALQFPLRHPAVRSVVVGAVTPAQVRENVRLLRTPVPQDLWDFLDERSGVEA